MGEQNNATCSICGNPYHLCLSCKDSMKLHPWKIHCCSPDCYKTFQVVKGYNTGVYTKEEFKSKLKNIDLSNLENYKENIKVLIKDTLKEEKEEFVVKEPIVSSLSRKRNYRVNKGGVNKNIDNDVVNIG